MSSRNIVPDWTFPDQLLQTAILADTHVEPGTNKPMQKTPQLFGQEAVSQLNSDQQQELLNAVDELRRANISGKDFSIPQIIVCGDQSAGKSSVLEAISQLRFPVGEGTTTKLAIEVVLRNNPSPSTTPVTLTIGAGASRTQEQKADLQRFSVKVNLDDPKAFSDAVDKALNYLKQYEPKEKFWYDRLHVEISGPKQPNLTLVDLPGLIHNENQGKANAGDKDRIKDLVEKYIREPKAIVLAVVSASNNFANQIVAQLVKEYDAADRTMGILTKTDRLQPGSEEEAAAVELACDRNTTRSLGLGWHVLRNELRRGGQASQPVSYKDRDEVEQRFFAGDPWSQLDPNNTGIIKLRKKLSLTLFGLITHDLPNFVDLMESKLEHCRFRHDALGAARDSTDSQIHHLQRIQRDLQSLIQDALDGRQDRSDFASFFDGSPHRALRTTITHYSRNFATRMRESGKQYNVYSGECEQANWRFKNYSPELNAPNFYPPYKPNGVDTEPINISLGEYCRKLATFMDDTRGTSLQGFQAAGTQTAVFRQQSVYWSKISKKYIGACEAAALDFLKCAVTHVGGQYTGEKLMRTFVGPSFSEIGSKLEQKLNELLWPYQKSHPSTQNPSYSSRVRRYKKTQCSQDTEDSKSGEDETDHDASWAQTALKLNYQHDLVSAAEVLDMNDAYYDLALDTFVDNVTILGVEAILLDNIKTLLCYEDVAQLRGDRLAEVASEPPGAQQERDELCRQIGVLVRVIRTCKRHMQTGSSYSNSSLPTIERAVHRASGPPGKFTDAAKHKTAQATRRSHRTARAVAYRAHSTEKYGNLESHPAPGHPPVEFGSTSDDSL